MKISKLLLSIFILSVLIVSCNDDDDQPEVPKGDHENGLLISGEGSGASSGSVSFVSNDFSTVSHQVYSTVNAGSEFGVYLQSLAFDNERAFVIVDNQNTVTVVNRYTFEALGNIVDELSAPRYMAISNGVGYITNWGDAFDGSDDFVAVVDLDSYTVTSKISVGLGPERIVAGNGKLYVSHKGAYSNNNIVTVINLATNATSEITVKDKPDELYFDNSGDLIVLSEGNTIYDASWNVIGQTESAITKINTSNDSVSSELVFPAGQNPSLLAGYSNDLYYSIGNDIFKMNSDDTSLPSTSILTSTAAYLYGMAVDDTNLFLLDANFSAQSNLDIYMLSSNTKTTSLKAPTGASKYILIN